jgi:hypothetical protein
VVVVLTLMAKRRGNREVEPEFAVDAGQRRCSRVPFIGPWRERSSRDANGNGGELQWLRPFQQ